MKKQVIQLLTASFIAIFFLNPLNGVAQSGKTWSIGPEVGLNLFKYGNDAPQNDYKLGLGAGVFLTYSIINTFGVTAKALLTQKGRQYVENGNTVKETLNYLEIPLLARFFLTREGSFRPNVFVGPSFNYLFGGTRKTGNTEAQKIPNYKTEFNTFELGATAGIGLNFEFAHETRFLLDARYNYGFSDITAGGGSWTNQGFNIGVGVSFGLQ